MLIVVQFPFADSRPFLAGTRCIQHPNWKSGGAGFVRTFGQMRPRLKGGLKEWPNEEFFCSAKGVPRFVPPLHSRFSRESGWGAGRCAFRRLLSNGRGLTRVEVGISIEHGFRSAPAESVMRAVEDVLSLDVCVPSGAEGNLKRKLFESPGILAKHYLLATTRTKPIDGFAPSSWWVTAGEPLVFVEIHEALVVPGRTFQAVTLPWPQYRLHYTRTIYAGQYCGVWVLSAGPAHTSFINHVDRTSEDEIARGIRLHLLRLHAERQTLKLVLEHIDNLSIPVQPRSPECDRLQDFLNRATGLLMSKRVYGVEMSKTLQAIESFDDLVAPGRRASLLTLLSDIRPGVFKKVKEYTDTVIPGTGGNVYVSGSSTVTVQVSRQGGQFVSQFVDNKGAVIHGDFIVADQITNSFNRIKDSKIDTDLKTSLEGLAKAVSGMATTLPQDTARDAAKALDTVTREATSEKPDEDYFMTGAAKLVKIAKTIADTATPVIGLVGTVAKLLGFAFVGG